MTKLEFINKIEEICLIENCSISDAIDTIMHENRITNTEFIALFCKGKNSIDDTNIIPKKINIV
ncbi:hypothetical protein Ccar_13910 [Clostridium carboxidivorans P7]|uniref:Uncharacterized protein n=1 Tax=Clostridium carboxidivorans P7 TaxID=536227 RepID=C6PS58_9CLOT|nr:hypothetical protein [Clostridium carboxidivorans]AKN31894.1 hypothetical protein Ccar_13910 [Clostridium carboxidivorans P7]EET87983.1 hypothetical protein CcarbDRAFT_1625 [Clostridium carboxidivorans P7]